MIQRVGGVLHVGGVSAEELVREHGTPLYAYCADTIRDRLALLRSAYGSLLEGVHYSVKALSNLSILRLLEREGAGFDIVSGGELARCLRVGIDPARIVFAGVGKSDQELGAALDAGVGTFNVESREEFHRLGALAAGRGRRPAVALRVNPDVDAQTHPHITTGREHNKFGMAPGTAWSLLEEAGDELDFVGFHLHIGSQITRPEPLLEVARAARALVEEARRRGARVRSMNLGGGLGVRYLGPGLDLEAALAPLRPVLAEIGVPLVLEPGRFLVAEAGVLLSRVLRVKAEEVRRFVVLDAGMNDLMRPALYQAQHEIVPVREVEGETVPTDLVGPICESADCFGKDRAFPPVRSGDAVAILSAGAYGSSMSSHYNSRPLAAEVLVDGGRARVIRRRESPEDLWRAELPLDDEPAPGA